MSNMLSGMAIQDRQWESSRHRQHFTHPGNDRTMLRRYDTTEYLNYVRNIAKDAKSISENMSNSRITHTSMSSLTTSKEWLRKSQTVFSGHLELQIQFRCFCNYKARKCIGKNGSWLDTFFRGARRRERIFDVWRSCWRVESWSMMETRGELFIAGGVWLNQHGTQRGPLAMRSPRFQVSRCYWNVGRQEASIPNELYAKPTDLSSQRSLRILCDWISTYRTSETLFPAPAPRDKFSCVKCCRDFEEPYGTQSWDHIRF